ncbi:hypothetical protein GF412_01640 [Candidatus Micrarchaeota archaeon]|nr:hypothetical protein [Candidatus Micrarchaeota archaeon]MBD3417667.1 hypothetical protein [Candidatus Micrarchaeota archaeon]
MDIHKDLLNKVGDKSWEEIALIARDLEVKIEHEDEEARQLEKKMQVIKQVLYETMNDPDRMKHLSSKFYVRLNKLMDEMEGKLKKYRADRQEFVVFIRILLTKLKKEKLVVTHKLDRRVEFGKHKKDAESSRKEE